LYSYSGGKRQNFKPWLGDLFAGMYDRIMEKSVFPKKFQASLETHEQVLKEVLENVHSRDVLELACGSGAISKVLPPNNRYTGLDISKGLLKIASKRLRSAGFSNPRLILASADNPPLEDTSFDVCLCQLSFNFFDNIPGVAEHVARLLRPGGFLLASIPVPERKQAKSTIHGTLLSGEQWQQLFTEKRMDFSLLEQQNGALLYFRAEKTPSSHRA